MRSRFRRIQIERACKGATGHIELYPSEISDIKIPIPPRPIQDRIAEIMEEAYKKSFVITLKDLKEGKRCDPFYYLSRFKEPIKQLERRDDILSLKEIKSTKLSKR